MSAGVVMSAAVDLRSSQLTPGLELLLFGLAALLTVAVVSVFVFAVLRHANRDGEGRAPSPSDDREAL